MELIAELQDAGLSVSLDSGLALPFVGTADIDGDSPRARVLKAWWAMHLAGTAATAPCASQQEADQKLAAWRRASDAFGAEVARQW